MNGNPPTAARSTRHRPRHCGAVNNALRRAPRRPGLRRGRLRAARATRASPTATAMRRERLRGEHPHRRSPPTAAPAARLPSAPTTAPPAARAPAGLVREAASPTATATARATAARSTSRPTAPTAAPAEPPAPRAAPASRARARRPRASPTATAREADGCEVTLATSVRTAARAAMRARSRTRRPSAAAGACGFSVCDVGFADVDGVQANGCEVDLSTDARNDGPCGQPLRHLPALVARRPPLNQLAATPPVARRPARVERGKPTPPPRSTSRPTTPLARDQRGRAPGTTAARAESPCSSRRASTAGRRSASPSAARVLTNTTIAGPP